LHLRDVLLAIRALGEMRLESHPIVAEKCALQVLGDQLDQLAARHLLSIAARHVS